MYAKKIIYVLTALLIVTTILAVTLHIKYLELTQKTSEMALQLEQQRDSIPKIPALRQQLGYLQTINRRLKYSLTRKLDSMPILQQLYRIAAASGMAITTIKPLPPRVQGQYEILPVVIIATGALPVINRLLNALPNLPYFSVISGITIIKERELQMELDFMVFSNRERV